MSLKASRTNAGLTSKQVAEMVGIHQQTLLKYEKDSSKIPIDLLNKLSIIYQIKSDDIFLGKEYDLIRTIEIKRKASQPS
ncbi:helix-turn-helix transcriptional regulator [Facklamia sp. P13069]|uniref:helix-turn-helix transcriptional regulator n=1 Tax=Facklamia sp. P13069 TaxID=3421954 RepID=UPI003D16778D